MTEDEATGESTTRVGRPRGGMKVAARIGEGRLRREIAASRIWPRRRILEFPFGNLGVWRGVEIGKFLEIWGSGEVWKLEIPEIRPSKCLISSPVEI